MAGSYPGGITRPASRFPRSTWVSSAPGSETVTTLRCGVCSSCRTSAAPSGPERWATTPRRGVNEPPNVAPRIRISAIGNTKTKKMFVRTRNIRRRLAAAIHSAFIAHTPSGSYLSHPRQAEQRQAPRDDGEPEHRERGHPHHRDGAAAQVAQPAQEPRLRGHEREPGEEARGLGDRE